MARGLCSEWGVGRGTSQPGTPWQRLRGSQERPQAEPPALLPLRPPVCYISALVLSCLLTFFVLIRSLVTHRLVAGSVQTWGEGQSVTGL